MHEALIHNDSSAHSHAVHNLMPQPQRSKAAKRYDTATIAQQRLSPHFHTDVKQCKLGEVQVYCRHSMHLGYCTMPHAGATESAR